MSAIELTEGSALQQYCVLAKSSKGKAVTALIQQVISAPNVFVFGELIDMPNVKQVLTCLPRKYYNYSDYYYCYYHCCY